jgi:hypothetical protein
MFCHKPTAHKIWAKRAFVSQAWKCGEKLARDEEPRIKQPEHRLEHYPHNRQQQQIVGDCDWVKQLDEEQPEANSSIRTHHDTRKAAPLELLQCEGTLWNQLGEEERGREVNWAEASQHKNKVCWNEAQAANAVNELRYELVGCLRE